MKLLNDYLVPKSIGIKRMRHEKDISKYASAWINFSVRDPRIGSVTITGVKISPDLKNATINYIGEAHFSNKATGSFKRYLANKVSMRLIPAIRFKKDSDYLAEMRLEKIFSHSDEVENIH